MEVPFDCDCTVAVKILRIYSKNESHNTHWYHLCNFGHGQRTQTQKTQADSDLRPKVLVVSRDDDARVHVHESSHLHHGDLQNDQYVVGPKYASA